MLADAYRAMGVDMFILQFGGNVMPYIEDEQACINYGNWFASQIKYLKVSVPMRYSSSSDPAICPPRSVRVCDPSVVTQCRDALRKAALQSGAAYF